MRTEDQIAMLCEQYGFSVHMEPEGCGWRCTLDNGTELPFESPSAEGAVDIGIDHIINNIAKAENVIGFWYSPVGERGETYVTLKRDVTRTWEDGGPTDEGWWHSEEYLTYTLDRWGNASVERHISSAAQDCDGRLDRDHYDVWFPQDYPKPTWVRGNTTQRDYAAEAMGY